MILKPVHLAAYLLNPNYFGSDLTNTQHIEAIQFIDTLLSNHPLFVENKEEILIQLTNYLGKNELWAMEFVWTAAKRTDSTAWWRGLCSKTKLSLPASSAATERSFSSYSFIHSKRLNKLTTERAGELVFIRCNRKLLLEDGGGQEEEMECSSFNLETEITGEQLELERTRRGPNELRKRRQSSSSPTAPSNEEYSVHSTTSCADDDFSEPELSHSEAEDNEIINNIP